MPKRRVFVVSPIGAAGSKVRLHADDVFNNLITPALKAIEEERPDVQFAPPIRGDHFDTHDDDIMRQVLKGLRDSDLIIVLLTFQRPNVLYELGIADCTGRPTVLLARKSQSVLGVTSGEPLPFDIAHRRVAQYRRPGDATAVKELAKAISGTLFNPNKSANTYMGPFDGRIDAFGEHNQSVSVYERFSGIPYTEYSKLFGKAEDFIWIAGTSMLDFSHTDINPWDYTVRGENRKINFPQLVLNKLMTGVDFTVFMMSEDNPALPYMLIQTGDELLESLAIDINEFSVTKVQDEIRRSAAIWRRIQEEAERAAPKMREMMEPGEKLGQLKIVKVNRGIVYSRVSMTEKEVLISPNYYTLPRNGHGPSMRAISNTNLYRTTRADLEYLAKINAAPSAQAA